MPEVIPPAVLYPLVQGGRRGRSIYGTARVIFSLQEGHGSSRHPHNHLKSSCGRGRSKNLDELGRYPLIGKVGTQWVLSTYREGRYPLIRKVGTHL